MIVALRSIAPRAGLESSQAAHLAGLAALDPQCPHRLSDDLDEADALLLTDAVAGFPLARALLTDPVIQRHRDKVYLYAEEARPFRPLPGLYTSYPRTPIDGRVSRAIGYPCWPLNPCIDRHAAAPPPRDPDLLYSFLGRRSHPVRDRMLRMSHPEDTHVVDTTKRYVHFSGSADERREHERAYVEIALRSRFALCPRGWATSTIRLYEMMALGVAPVVLGDSWVPPHGPDWERFTIFVPERDAARLPDILRERESDGSALGKAAFRAFRDYFSPERHFRTITTALADLLDEPQEGRRRLRRAWPLTLPAMSGRQAFRSLVRMFGG